MVTQEWAQLGGLMFVARRLVEGLWAGRHVARGLGPGWEFHDYRPYAAGEDVAEVDWKLFGRTDRHFIRRYRQLTDLQVHLLVDVSASMGFSGLKAQPAAPTKLQYASLLAAALAFLTVRQFDRAGLGLCARGLIQHVKPAGSWAHLQRLCVELEKAQPQAGAGDLPAGLQQTHALLHQRGLVVLISDLWDDSAALFNALERFRHDRFDLIVFQVLTPEEISLPGAQGGLRLTDAETGRGLAVNLDAIRPFYADQIREHLALWRRGCTARGIDYHLLTTEQSVAAALRQYLWRRRSRGL